MDGYCGCGGRGVGEECGAGGVGVRAAVFAGWASEDGRERGCERQFSSDVIIPRQSARLVNGRHQPSVRHGPAALRQRSTAQRKEIRRQIWRSERLSGLEAEYAIVDPEAVLEGR